MPSDMHSINRPVPHSTHNIQDGSGVHGSSEGGRERRGEKKNTDEL